MAVLVFSADTPAPDRTNPKCTKGEPPPSTLKVAMNELAGHRNQVSVALTGLVLILLLAQPDVGPPASSSPSQAPTGKASRKRARTAASRWP